MSRTWRWILLTALAIEVAIVLVPSWRKDYYSCHLCRAQKEVQSTSFLFRLVSRGEIAAPTMRVPMILGDTVNPYLAARAALLLVRHGVFPSGSLVGEPISKAVESAAFPGLGTGVGSVSPDVCARQVRAAVEEVVLGAGEFPATWVEAQAKHQMLYTDRARDLQIPS